MDRSDMVSHKLCAMLSRKAPRDVFDVWFFLSKGFALNESILKERTGLNVQDFLKACLVSVSKVSPSSMMTEIGELLDDSLKPFVRSGELIKECKVFLEDYLTYPVIEPKQATEHTSLLLNTPGLLMGLRKASVDPSELSVNMLNQIICGEQVEVRNTKGMKTKVQYRSGRLLYSYSNGIK